MNPQDFIKTISENGQVPAFVGEATRRKALTLVLEAAAVVDGKGKAVDLGEFLKSDSEMINDHAGHDHD